MPLISTSDQQRLREALSEMARPVRLLLFTQTVGCETCVQTRQILDELPPLADKISVEEVNFVLEPERAAQYKVDRVPAIVVLYGDAPPDSAAQGVAEGAAPADLKDSRIRFVGTPAGYEFMSLVHAVLLAGGGPSTLTDENRTRVMAHGEPVTIQVFTTPT